jgi:hypothetical protein
MAANLPSAPRLPRWRARTATLALALALAATGAFARASRAAAAEPGVNISSLTASQFGMTHTLGTHWTRMFVSWRALEPRRGTIDPELLAGWESVLRQQPAGTHTILDVFGSPQWETGSSDERAPPANPQDYADALATLASRFGGLVSAYEIWNEEDDAGWWSGGADPGAYAALLRATYPAIKAANHNATVVLGGLTGNDYPFLEKVYTGGGRGYFDAVGVHTDTACNVLSPYEFLRGADNRLIPDSFLAYREVRQTMLANGDDKPIWMTELSWRTTSAVCSEGAWAGQKPEGVSEDQQALFLREAYHCLAQDNYLQVALWYPLQDGGPVRSGLLRSDGSQKPSFAAMRSYVQSGDKLSEPCGVTTGPRLRVLSPANNTSYSGPLPIRVVAQSGNGVGEIKLKIDGKLIRNFVGRTYPASLSGVLVWQGAKHISLGRHTLSFISFDKERNASETSVAIVHLPKPSKRHHSHVHRAGGAKGAGPAAHKKAHRHSAKKRSHRRHKHRRRHRHH